jgi:hypothetical protein
MHFIVEQITLANAYHINADTCVRPDHHHRSTAYACRHLVDAGAVVHGELQRGEVPRLARVELPPDLVLDAREVHPAAALARRDERPRQVGLGLGPLRQHGAAVADVHHVHVGALDQRHQHARPDHGQLRALGRARLRLREVPGLRAPQGARQRVQHVVVAPLLPREGTAAAVAPRLRRLVRVQPQHAIELAAHGRVQVRDEVVGGVGPVEAVVDADEHPAVLLRHHHVHPVLPGLPARPLHLRRGVLLLGGRGNAGARAQQRRDGPAEAAEERQRAGRLLLPPVPRGVEVREDLVVGATRHRRHARVRGGRRRAAAAAAAVQRARVLARLERPEREGVGAVEGRGAGEGRPVGQEHGAARRGLVRRQQHAVDAAIEAENVADAGSAIVIRRPCRVVVRVVGRRETGRGQPRHAVAHRRIWVGIGECGAGRSGRKNGRRGTGRGRQGEVRARPAALTLPRAIKLELFMELTRIYLFIYLLHLL